MKQKIKLSAQDVLDDEVPCGRYKCACGYVLEYDALSWMAGHRSFSIQEVAENHTPLKSVWLPM